MIPQISCLEMIKINLLVELKNVIILNHFKLPFLMWLFKTMYLPR
jgi:hypothetical protein